MKYPFFMPADETLDNMKQLLISIIFQESAHVNLYNLAKRDLENGHDLDGDGDVLGQGVGTEGEYLIVLLGEVVVLQDFDYLSLADQLFLYVDENNLVLDVLPPLCPVLRCLIKLLCNKLLIHLLSYVQIAHLVVQVGQRILALDTVVTGLHIVLQIHIEGKKHAFQLILLQECTSVLYVPFGAL